MKKFGLLIIFILMTFSANAQTTLSAGDIAIVGINCDTSPYSKAFAFVLLKDIEAQIQLLILPMMVGMLLADLG
ncbi:MAG: hypothetical protein ABI638_06545 [Ignavibacteriota bacterium]